MTLSDAGEIGSSEHFTTDALNFTTKTSQQQVVCRKSSTLLHVSVVLTNVRSLLSHIFCDYSVSCAAVPVCACEETRISLEECVWVCQRANAYVCVCRPVHFHHCFDLTSRQPGGKLISCTKD